MTLHRTNVSRRMERRIIAIALTCGLICTATWAASADEIVERVLATVAGHVIMASDVAAARALGLVSVESEADPIRAALSRLIDRALVLTEVDRYAPPEPDEAAITRAVETVRSRFPNPGSFEALLRRVGLDEAHVRERLRQDLRISAYLDQRFTTSPGSDGDADPAARALAEERRVTRVEEWIEGLRRRSEIATFY